MPKMVNCKACNTEIASSAKACPKCGAKRSGWVKKTLLVILGVLFVLTIIGLLLPDDGTYSRSPSRSSSSAPVGTSTPAQKSFSVGETVTSGDFAVSVQEVFLRQQVGGEFFAEQASSGAVYIVVHYAYINEADRPKNPFDVPTITLIDPNGVEYDEDIGASGVYATEVDLNSKLLSEVNPGIQIDNAGVFEIAQSRFDQSGWSVKVDNGRNDFFVPIN